MKRVLWQTFLVLMFIAGLCAPILPAYAANPGNGAVAVDGDAHFHAFAAAAAKVLPKVSRPAKNVTIQGDALGQVVAFWAYDFKNNSYYQTNATLVRLGNHVAVYVENGLNVAEATLNDIVTQFDNRIYPTLTSTFGSEPNPGIDGDPRITVLLLNIRDAYYYNAGNTYVAGYFSAVNEYLQSDLDAWFPGQHKSNQREMIYLDANPAQPGTASFYFTIAHEFQHLIHWNNDPDEETWVNEGLADLAGYLAGYGHPASHLNAFLNDPNDSLAAWSGTLADYGAAYLYALYLWEKFGGQDTIRALVAEQANGTAGVDAALAARGYGDRFGDTFARWVVANYLDDTSLANGAYGYTSLDLVDTGADNVTRFNRPRLAGNHVSYPVSNGSGSVRGLAAQYLKFAGATGTLTVNLNGDDGGNFKAIGVATTSTGFNAGTNALLPMTLNAAQDGTLTVPNFGSAYVTVLLVVANQSGSLNQGSYTYSATVATAPTPTPLPSPTPSPAVVTATIALQAGWNMVSLPVSPTTPLTAEGLLRAINAQGGQVTEIDRWHAGGWNAHILGLPLNDFPIEVGRGYFVKATKASTLTITGYSLTTAPVLYLSVGWNLVAFPYLPKTYTAESLIQAIGAQGGEVKEIYRWYGGGWNGHLAGLPFNDFPIQSGQAYFVKANKPSTFRP